MHPMPCLKNQTPASCRIFLYFLLFLVIVIIPAQKTAAQSKKPNIIFILGDDIGYNTPTVNGGRSYSTPSLDSMAQGGMNFTECHASPLCSPSRVMLLTGKYNFRNYTEWGNMDTSQRTIANMLKDAGYKTACYGKWQLDGGDASLHKFGFDDYCVWLPFIMPDQARYKNPVLYTNNAYLPDSLTQNKYGEDIVVDSLENFIEQNKDTSFFIYYPMLLAHPPFQPTPDDSDFSTWSFPNRTDTGYYPSMIKYMDKKIGEIIRKVKNLGIGDNTLIIYTGDNGTPTGISELIEGDSTIRGGKGTTTEFGTHVPLIFYWPNTITAGTINNDLIGFTDFMPTFADIAGTQTPAIYEPLDGVSFAPQLKGETGNPRSSLFYHYDDHPGSSKLIRWAQTSTYKLYDTSATDTSRRFYNIQKDIHEKTPIPDSLLSPQEVLIKQQLLNVINSYVAQGTPIFSNIAFSALTDSSIILKDSILIDGGSTITKSGFVWGANANPAMSSSKHVTNNIQIGTFADTIKGLTPNKTYYIRAYAVNNTGINYSSQIKIKTLLPAPLATQGSSVDSSHFFANWHPVTGAGFYKLSVSLYPTFSAIKSLNLTENFNNGTTAPDGWMFKGNIRTDSSDFLKAYPSIVFNASKSQITTKVLDGRATQLKFWLKGLNTKYASSLLVEGFNGSEWIPLKTYNNLSKTGSVKTINFSSNPPLPDSIIQFRFTYTKAGGTLALDDISINYSVSSPSFIPGYNNLLVKDTSQIVTGLKPKTVYYYRVRAGNGSVISENSNVITASTCIKPVISNLNITNATCYGNNNGAADVIVEMQSDTLSYNWVGPNNFASTNQNIDSLIAGNYTITITASSGCSIDSTISITQPTQLDASINADSITCAGATTILTVNATGGTGNYHYTLSDGTNTTGPQDDNHFTVSAGNYTVVVEDDNHCSFTTSSIQITEPIAINATANADSITCAGATTTLTVNATGGSGNYHYTLSDGTNTTGPQDDNHFTVTAGNYIITVTDDNGCTTNAPVLIADGTEPCNGITSANIKSSAQKNPKSSPVKNNLSINVFPNPTVNGFTVSVKTSNSEKIKMYVTDVYGRVVYQLLNVNQQNYYFGKHFGPGVYFINVIQGTSFKTLKLIKEK